LTPQSDGSRVGDELLFQVPRSDVASGNVDLRILVKPNILSSALYEYKCFVDGVELRELAQAPPASASPSPNFKINVHEYRVEVRTRANIWRYFVIFVRGENTYFTSLPNLTLFWPSLRSSGVLSLILRLRRMLRGKVS
jgi:hypothetical protein